MRNGAEIAGGFGGRAYQRIDQFDTRQIELYRGAQGSLYGRNAVGGVFNLINNAPVGNFEYSLLTSYDFTKEETRLEGIVNTPLIEDRLFLRVGLMAEDEKGLYTNDFFDEPGVPYSLGGARVALRGFFNESVDATLFVDYEVVESDNYIESSFRRGGLPGLTYFTAGARGVNGALLPSNSLFPANAPLDQYRQAQDTPGFFDQTTFNTSLTVNADLPFATFQSITNFRDRHFDVEFDSDGSYLGGPMITGLAAGTVLTPGANNLQCGTVTANAARQPISAVTTRKCITSFFTQAEIFTQEFRLVSPDEGRFSWLAGIDYRFFNNPIKQFTSGRFPNTTGRGQFFNYLSDADLLSYQWGAFVSAGYDLTDQLNIAGSVRASEEHSSIDLKVIQLDTNQVEFDQQPEDTFQNIDPSVTLTYDFGDHLLFASASEGHRSGGFNRGFGNAVGAFGTLGVVVPLKYEEENAISYELGTKGEISFGSVDLGYGATAFRVEYTDILRNVPVLTGGDSGDADSVLLGTQLANLGDAYVQGVEIDWNARVPNFLWSDGDLNLTGGFTYSESEITSGVVSGRELSDLPERTWNGTLSYRRALPFFENSGLGMFANLNYEHESEVQNQGNTAVSDQRQRVNARLGIEGGRRIRSVAARAVRRQCARCRIRRSSRTILLVPRRHGDDRHSDDAGQRSDQHRCPLHHSRRRAQTSLRTCPVTNRCSESTMMSKLTVWLLCLVISACAQAADHRLPVADGVDQRRTQFDVDGNGQIDAEERSAIRSRYYSSAGNRTTPNPAVENISGRLVEETHYPSIDGRRIPAVISRPAETGRYPVVVTIHGGQGDRDYGYLRTMAAPSAVSPTVEMFNRQPWIVVAISYRSSAFLGVEEDDVLAGIRFAKNLAGVDPQRVCVMGGSHGGNLALRAAERMGNEFRCVIAGSPWMPNPFVYLLDDVSEAPISDLTPPARQLLIDNRDRLARGLSLRLNDTELRDLLSKHSIEGQADKIKIPVLFLTSLGDEQVPHVLVQPTIDRAKSAGADVSTFIAQVVPHGFYWGRNQGGARIGRGPKSDLELSEEAMARKAILTFLTKWLG